MVGEDAQVILTRMRELLMLGWCRRAIARDAFNEPCHPCSTKAKSWSLHGASLRAAEDTMMEHVFPSVRDALKDYIWANHRLYLMWCDDDPQFSAKKAIDAVSALRAP